jgi:hypothetical protein
MDSAGLQVTGRLQLLEGSGAGLINSTAGSNTGTVLDVEFPDVTNTSAKMRLFRNTNTSGAKALIIYRGDASATVDHRFNANGGAVHGPATGSDKGVGTINVSADIYKNNSAYTSPDYALELWRDVRIEEFKDNPGAAEYTRLSLDEVEAYIREHLRLPGFGNDPSGLFDRADLVLEKLEELYTHVIEINHRLEGVEDGYYS